MVSNDIIRHFLDNLASDWKIIALFKFTIFEDQLCFAVASIPASSLLGSCLISQANFHKLDKSQQIKNMRTSLVVTFVYLTLGNVLYLQFPIVFTHLVPTSDGTGIYWAPWVGKSAF